MINFSHLLWKSQPAEDQTLPAPLNEELLHTDGQSDPLVVPVEKVDIDPGARIALLTDPEGPGADRFRLLRMRFREVKAKTKLRSLVITSPLPEDGKSTIAINLATALAEGGKRSVLLVEADLHHPTVSQSVRTQGHPGLAECLEAGVDPLSVIRRLQPPSWYLLPAGELQGNPTELLQSDSLADMMRRLSPMFDWILIDTPPVAPLSDALSVSRHTDASLLVVRADQTPRSAVGEALDLLGRAHVLGIIFNGAERLNRLYSKYYGYYGKK